MQYCGLSRSGQPVSDLSATCVQLPHPKSDVPHGTISFNISYREGKTRPFDVALSLALNPRQSFFMSSMRREASHSGDIRIVGKVNRHARVLIRERAQPDTAILRVGRRPRRDAAADAHIPSFALGRQSKGSAFRSNYASGASSKEARRTRSFMEGHGVAAVVMEDRALALHRDGARLVGVVPACRGIAVAVVQRLLRGEECVLHSCLIDATVREKVEGDTRFHAGCRSRRDVALPRCWGRTCAQHCQRGCPSGDASNISGCHAPILSDGNCVIKNLDPDRVSIANRSRPLKIYK